MTRKTQTKGEHRQEQEREEEETGKQLDVLGDSITSTATGPRNNARGAVRADNPCSWKEDDHEAFVFRI